MRVGVVSVGVVWDARGKRCKKTRTEKGGGGQGVKRPYVVQH